MAFGRLNRANDEVARWERPRRIVDEHDLRRGSRERLEPRQHTLLARRPANRGIAQRRGRAGRQMRQRLVVEGAVIGMDRDHDGRERPGGGQRLQRMGEEGPPGAVEILLRPLPAEPRAAAGGDDDERDVF